MYPCTPSNRFKFCNPKEDDMEEMPGRYRAPGSTENPIEFQLDKTENPGFWEGNQQVRMLHGLSDREVRCRIPEQPDKQQCIKKGCLTGRQPSIENVIKSLFGRFHHHFQYISL